MELNLFGIPPHVSFLDAIVEGWLARYASDDPLSVGRGLIMLPTRRSARGLADAFLRVSDGKPMLLPRIMALGALDEAPLALEGVLDLPPAVEPMHRLSVLTGLILAMNGHAGAPRAADRAWLLADELARLMDDAERAEVDLALRLPGAADAAFAQHWAETLQFLRIVTEAWPVWLSDNGLMNPAARQIALLNAQAEAWSNAPPADPVLIAGTTAGIPAVARLLKVVARMPAGMVVLPVLDRIMTDTEWAALDDSHAQAGLARLLEGLGATRADVRPWPSGEAGAVPEARFDLLSRAMLPAKALDGWRRPASVDLTGVQRLKPADAQEEAESIALVLRNALETPDARAALVTPDRDLAGRVAAELLRYGVIADDSAGEKLSETPPAVFLRLLTRAVAEELAPVALLALLKHPLAAAGLTPGQCRDEARRFEIRGLRGPRPSHGIVGLRLAAVEAKSEAFLQRLEACLEPALRVDASVAIAPAEALAAIVEAAERLAATTEESGAARLWAGEDGDALATHLSSALAALQGVPDQRRAVLPGLLDAILEGQAIRSRRATRGRDGTEHPRIFIWGLLEARLQAIDLLVLGGLVESVWPPMSEPGPWLSRPMRTTVGLPSPEQAVGQAAHDFVGAMCSAREVVLSCAARRDGAPAVPSRWLSRLEMFLRGKNMALPEHPASRWARALDLPADGPHPVEPPRPNPPIALRPSVLSVTEIETWLRDPYAIYARHVLMLRALKPLDEETDAADYGTVVHAGLNLFLKEFGTRWPPNAAARLRGAMDRALSEAGFRRALAAWWEPRLRRIADWVAEAERDRRSDSPPVEIATEIAGAMEMLRPGRAFRLIGRADRVERRADGRLVILDYKTGRIPTDKEVENGLAPQLLLEAAMALVGGFGPNVTGVSADLCYWHLTGRFIAGSARHLYAKHPEQLEPAVIEARESLGRLIDSFDDPDRCYLAQPHPDRTPRFSDYAQLSRVAEWAAAGDDA